jgi:hypothetical protein
MGALGPQADRKYEPGSSSFGNGQNVALNLSGPVLRPSNNWRCRRSVRCVRAFLANHFSLGYDILFTGVILRRPCGNPVGLTRGFAIFRFSTEVGTDPTNRVRE